ncbi:glycoside hydrolase family 1 protein [Candidatus Omnitrophota bacterium]
MQEFPKGFFWGAATSAHQVEGNNIHSDWWDWERKSPLIEPSGEACRHYQLFKQDFDLAKSLSHNAHRLSIPWSRIEPEDGRFDSREIEHYRDVILALKERNIEPIVTLHHFTSPLWFAKLGGWGSRKAEGYFCRFAEKVVESLSGEVKYWVTINEPIVYIYHSYILGAWPPHDKSFLRAFRVRQNMLLAHKRVYHQIHGIYRKAGLSSPLVSIAKNMQAFFSTSGSLRDKFALRLKRRLYNFEFLERLMSCSTLDFIGLNYYTRGVAGGSGWNLRSMLVDTDERVRSVFEKNYLGWDIYPQGLFDVLLSLKRYAKPVMILENGICTNDDRQRWEYIRAHLESVSCAMKQGCKVSGYIYWSLMDNFEWDQGFGPRFGLINVDYRDFKRTVRESAKRFAGVCRTGRLD